MKDNGTLRKQLFLNKERFPHYTSHFGQKCDVHWHIYS